MNSKRYLECGRIVNTHGTKGEVKVEPWSDSPEFFQDIQRVFIRQTPHRILSARIHKNMVILRLEGIEDIDMAAAYKGQVLFIDKNDVELDEGAFFIQDIIGFQVFNEDGSKLGVLKEVLDMPAGNIYVVAGQREHLIPAVPEFVKKVDLKGGSITVSLIEGM